MSHVHPPPAPLIFQPPHPRAPNPAQLPRFHPLTSHFFHSQRSVAHTRMPHNSIAFIRLLHTSLYTGDLALQAENWGRHEAEDEDDKSEEGGEAAGRVQGNGIVDGDDAQELLSQEKG